MSLPENYMVYSERRYGMDHDRYEWRDLFETAPVEWPDKARVMLSVVVHLQHFPLDMAAKPFKAPGSLSMPYPDFRYYTNRDYGNRLGAFRLLRVLADKGIRATFAINAIIAARYPELVRAVAEAGHEIACHGYDMGKLHHSGLSEAEEDQLIADALALLRGTGARVTGWASPGRAQSFNTPDLLAKHGIGYALDWANDDMPYAMKTANGPLLAMPMAYETDDQVAANEYFHSDPQWQEQVRDRFDVLYRESETYGGRIMSLPLHAWVSGMPYRIAYLEEVLDYILSHPQVSAAPVGEIAAAWSAK